MTLGQMLKERRKKYDLNQSRLATLVNVSQGTISKYENDELVPSLVEAFQLSQILSLSINQIALTALKDSKEK